MGDARSDDGWATGLARAAGAGDRAALTTFIRATQRDVYRFLLYLCAPDEVESLTRETYLRALRALPRFTGRCCARTWLLSIARQVAADQIPRTSARAPAPTVDDRDLDEGAQLRALVAGLEGDRRDAFVLTQVLGLDYAAAAEVCGCPAGTIRSRVVRAREDLVRAMNALGQLGRNSTGP